MDKPPSSPRLFSPAAVVASCLGFVLIGALQALYGPVLLGPRPATTSVARLTHTPDLRTASQ